MLQQVNVEALHFLMDIPKGKRVVEELSLDRRKIASHISTPVLGGQHSSPADRSSCDRFLVSNA